MSMRDAVARFVPDGASICMGTALEALIPFAAGHELIRQRRRDLTLIGPISDILFDQLIGAGCVRRVIAAWVGNVSAGLGYNYRRAVEQRVPGPIEVEDHSNLTIAFALQAAALGVPYLPTRSLLGTDLPNSNPTFKAADRSLVGHPAPAGARDRARRGDPPRAARRRGRPRARLGHAGRDAPGRLRGEARDHRGRGDPAARAHPERPGPRAHPRAQGGRGRPRAVGRVPFAGAGLLRPPARLLPPLPRGEPDRRRASGSGSATGSTACPTGRPSSPGSTRASSTRCGSPTPCRPSHSTTEPDP